MPEKLMRQIIRHPDDAAAVMITCKWGERYLRGLIGKLFDPHELLVAGELVHALDEEGRKRIMNCRWYIVRGDKYMTPRRQPRSRWIHVGGISQHAGGFSHGEWVMYMRVGVGHGGGARTVLYSYGIYNACKYMVALSEIESFLTDGYFHYIYNEKDARAIAENYKYPTVLFMRM